jgi:hypothetical protein
MCRRCGHTWIFEKTFTIDEAQSLLPVLESLLKRAIEGKQAAEQVESGLSELARRIYISGGMRVDSGSVVKQRAEMEAHLKLARESVAEIDAIGVQVKDLDTGTSGFSHAASTTRWCCSAGAWASPPSSTGMLSTPDSRTAGP